MPRMETLQENLNRMIEKRNNLNLAIEQLEQKIKRKEIHNQLVSQTETKIPSTENSDSVETEQGEE